MSGNRNRSCVAWVGRTVLLAALLAASVTSCKHALTPRQGWNKSYGPVVPHDKFPADCSLCHVGGNWTTIRQDFTFDHEAKTGVPLRGAHLNATCLMCHNDRGPTGVFAARGCAGCHEDPHRSKMGRLCADCHQEQSWRPKEIIARHNLTRFPLVGAHASTSCFRCHPGAQVGNFSGADTACTTCHRADLARAVSPNHIAQNWTTDCQKCHVPTGWKPARFKHPSAFPLTGGHGNLACTDCHKGGVFTGLSSACVSCHLSNYQKTTNPNHTSAGFSTDCATCHTTRSWQGARFNHPAAFPLTGGHGGLACASCHKGGIFTGLSTACVSCHLTIYQKTTSPNHVASGFSTDCTTCHTTKTWLGANFNHPAAFPLTGGHGGLACATCHKGGVFTGLSTACVSCHLTNYQKTTNPKHATAGFGTDCATCHSTKTWLGAVFNHTLFPITSGPHKVACAQCHTNSSNYSVFVCTNCHTQSATNARHNEVSGYKWTSAACYQCHRNGRAGD